MRASTPKPAATGKQVARAFAEEIDFSENLAGVVGLYLVARHIDDPETGGSYTVKLYDRVSPDAVRLVPDTDAPGFEPIDLIVSDADEVRVVAELVEVLPT